MSEEPKTDERLYEALGVRIYKARIRKNMRQEDLAGKVGLSRASMVNIEAGRQRISVHKLQRACAILGRNIANILKGL